MSEQSHELGDQDTRGDIEHTGEQDTKDIQETSLSSED